MKIRLTKVGTYRRLTLQGWLLITCIIMFFIFVWSITIHDFLAVNKPLETNLWIIEGYVPDFILENIAVEAKKNPDLMLICAGLSIEKTRLFGGYNNYADYNAAILQYVGVDSLQTVSAHAVYADKERTYTTALVAREKLKDLGYVSGNVNVVCVGTHARRSQLLYRKAFKPEWNVGVISYVDNNYPKQWWRTSEGARAVVYEMFAYLYCVIFFHP